MGFLASQPVTGALVKPVQFWLARPIWGVSSPAALAGRPSRAIDPWPRQYADRHTDIMPLLPTPPRHSAAVSTPRLKMIGPGRF